MRQNNPLQNLSVCKNKEIQMLNKVDLVRMTEVSRLHKMNLCKELLIILQRQVVNVFTKKLFQSKQLAGKNLKTALLKKFCKR